MVRALALNVRDVWFDPHPKLNFLVIIRCSRNLIPLFIIRIEKIILDNRSRSSTRSINPR